jgi:hypothetical protein
VTRPLFKDDSPSPRLAKLFIIKCPLDESLSLAHSDSGLFLPFAKNYYTKSRSEFLRRNSHLVLHIPSQEKFFLRILSLHTFLHITIRLPTRSHENYRALLKLISICGYSKAASREVEYPRILPRFVATERSRSQAELAFFFSAAESLFLLAPRFCQPSTRDEAARIISNGWKKASRCCRTDLNNCLTRNSRLRLWSATIIGQRKTFKCIQSRGDEATRTAQLCACINHYQFSHFTLHSVGREESESERAHHKPRTRYSSPR